LLFFVNLQGTLFLRLRKTFHRFAIQLAFAFFAKFLPDSAVPLAVRDGEKLDRLRDGSSRATKCGISMPRYKVGTAAGALAAAEILWESS
jgi:hypothetical protein